MISEVKAAYFDCSYGISCEKILSALINAGIEKENIISLARRLRIENVKIQINDQIINSVPVSQIIIINGEEFAVENYEDFIKLIAYSELQPEVKSRVIELYKYLNDIISGFYKSEAENVLKREFLSSGSLITITGVIEAFALWSLEKIFTNAISIGGGTGGTPEGKYPVPMPLILKLLSGLYLRNDFDNNKTVTATAAAILNFFKADNSSPMPAYKLISAGYGIDSSGAPAEKNIFSLIIGELKTKSTSHRSVILEFNVDDMNPQNIPYVIEKILSTGAADAYVTPVIMKKGRPGFLFTITTSASKEKDIINVIFRETTTIGIRKAKSSGVKLNRKISMADTSVGKIKIKEIFNRGGEKRFIPEFEEIKRIALEKNISLRDLQEKIFYELNYSKSTDKKL